jgi:hypothetical protein
MTHEEPRMMFFHYWGRGSAKDLANGVKGGLLVGGLLEVSSPPKQMSYGKPTASRSDD